MVVGPAQRRRALEPAPGGGEEQAAERGEQTGEHDLGLGVAEPGVELDDPRPARGERQPDVEHPGEGRAPTAHLVDDRLRHPVHDVVDQTLGGPVERAVGTHPAGVGAGVVVADPLEVLRGRERHDVGAVTQAEQRHLRPRQVLLDDDCAVGLGQAGPGVLEGLGPVVGDHDPLARGEPVVLDDVGAPRASRASSTSSTVVQTWARPVGTSAADMTPFANALLPSSCAARARGPNAAIPRSSTASATPATSGPSGPMTTRSTAWVTASATTPAASVTPPGSGSQRATASMPGLPGAATTASTDGSSDSERTMACSRAPDPTTSTFTRPNLVASAREWRARPGIRASSRTGRKRPVRGIRLVSSVTSAAAPRRPCSVTAPHPGLPETSPDVAGELALEQAHVDRVYAGQAREGQPPGGQRRGRRDGARPHLTHR